MSYVDHHDVISSFNSLERRIKHLILLNSPHISGKSLELAYKKLESLVEIDRRMLWSSSSIGFDPRFTAAVSKLSIVIGSISQLIDSQSGSCQGNRIPFFFDLEGGIHSFIKGVEKIEKDHAEELYYSWPEEEEEEEEDDHDAVSSRIRSNGPNSMMVGVSDQYEILKYKLMFHEPTSFKIFPLVGMPGIGKTTLAKKIFEDQDTREHFDCRVWVKVGRKCRIQEIPRRILAQLNPVGDQMLAGLRDEDATRCLELSLRGKKYLIVLDDVWDKYMGYRLQPSYPRDGSQSLLLSEVWSPFPEGKNGSRVLLTTRLQQVDGQNRHLAHDGLTMRLLNKDESWDLLHKKVFAKDLCPSQLEKAGKKIAENCEGLPLTIVMVANLLSKVERTPEYWSKVAAQKNHQLYVTAYDEISKVLHPSYKYLPSLLKMCFLYMGIFPQNYAIPRSKLINMWNVDEFLELNASKFSRRDPLICLEELVLNSLVMIYQRSITGEQIKTCGLHSSLWHLSNKEAGKIKFSCVLNNQNDGLGEGIRSQNRLSFHNNILFGIKDVYISVENNCASTARSLLFYGPYHQYQVPICFGLSLLRELDALTIRFYEFPLEVLKLVQLRYLALTLNGTLPASISQLSRLQFLIVNPHLSIKSCIGSLYLPMKIWNMKELKHVQVMESDLPDPCGDSLERLSTLSNVSARSCTESTLRAIPNLRKLGIRIELTPDDDGTPLRPFDHISHLYKLESLKCVVVNPKIVPAVAPPSISSFQLLGLTKLSLSGLGYPWKEMGHIASLPHLKVLKLRNYAFQGPKWEEGRGFSSLRFFVIEDTDLVEWNVGRESFRWLKSLSIKHCYKLEKVCGIFFRLDKIEIVDCNPLAEEQMRKAASLIKKKVDVRSSWYDGKLKI